MFQGGMAENMGTKSLQGDWLLDHARWRWGAGDPMNTAINKEAREASRYYRSLALICRQQAVRYPEASWSWLSEAQRWEELAAASRTRNG
jgi:hypothetical protein